MVQLAAWLLVCLAFAYATRHRPIVSVVAVVGLWVLVPSIAGSILTGVSGTALSFHPATWLAFAALGVQLLQRPGLVLAVAARRVYLLILLGLVIGVAVLATRFGGVGGGFALLADLLVGPVVIFALVLVALEVEPTALRTLRTTLLTLAALESALTIAQWLAGRALVYEAAQASRWWFAREGFDRWLGTFDHPLTLALFLCVVTPLLVGLRQTWLQLLLVALMTAAVVVTQSRTGTVVIAVVVAWVVLRSRASAGAKALLYLAIAGLGAWFAASAIAQGLGARFADDTGSADARRDALNFYIEVWDQHVFAGGGFTSSYRIAAVGGLSTSLESSFFMYAVDIGLVFAVLYFGAQAVLVLQGIGRPSLPGMSVAAVLALVLPHTYSALAAGGAAGMILWVVLAMRVADGTSVADPPRATLAAERAAVRV